MRDAETTSWLHSKLTDPMDPKILPVSHKDKLVGRDEKKVSDEKKDENDPSFDGLMISLV